MHLPRLFDLWSSSGFLFFKIYLFIMCVYTVAVFRHSRRGHQIFVTDGREPPCGCWDLNSGSLEEQSVLLVTEPSLQPTKTFFTFLSIYKVFGDDFKIVCTCLPRQFLIKLKKIDSSCFSDRSEKHLVSTFSAARVPVSILRVLVFMCTVCVS